MLPPKGSVTCCILAVQVLVMLMMEDLGVAAQIYVQRLATRLQVYLILIVP